VISDQPHDDELVGEGRPFDGTSDRRDESDRQGTHRGRGFVGFVSFVS
jgi:hypothetical protein